MVAVSVALAGALLVADASAAARDPRGIDAAAERVLDRRFQRIDERAPARGGGDRAADRRRVDRDGGEERRGARRSVAWREGGAGALSPLVSMLLWGALGIVALLVIVWIVRELVRARRDRAAAPARAARVEAPDEAAELAAPLDDADRLARDGRFAAAIHVLLLRTLEELVRVTARDVPRSLTSREILARIELVPEARAALAELVATVEVTWFGDDVPGEADWRRCRDRFERFVAAYHGAGPRVEAAA